MALKTGFLMFSLTESFESNFGILSFFTLFRGGSRTAAIYKMERFVILVSGFQQLTIITKRFILDAATSLDPTLLFEKKLFKVSVNCFRFRCERLFVFSQIHFLSVY